MLSFIGEFSFYAASPFIVLAFIIHLFQKFDIVTFYDKQIKGIFWREVAFDSLKFFFRFTPTYAFSASMYMISNWMYFELLMSRYDLEVYHEKEFVKIYNEATHEKKSKLDHQCVQMFEKIKVYSIFYIF